VNSLIELERLRWLREDIDYAQAHIKELTDKRDVIIADLLIERAATGDVIGAAAGVSQPRTVQIRNAVVLRRETAAAEAEAIREARRNKRRRKTGTDLVAVS
jgi:chorismate mutase